MLGNLIIRTDTGNKIGLGHFMRCFALAQAWRDRGGQVIFAMSEIVKTAEECLKGEGIDVQKIRDSSDLNDDVMLVAACAEKAGAAWIVLDGYAFNSDYQERLSKESGRKLMVIDDCGNAERYNADILLNQNLGADESLYRGRTNHSKLLLGSRYALIRRDLNKYLDYSKKAPDVARKLLICMGGGVHDEIAMKIINALHLVEIDDLDATVIIGSRASKFAEQKTSIQTHGRGIKIELNAKMSELMSESDIAITGGGSTCWELALMKVPMIVIVLADNQEPIAQNLEIESAAQNLGWHNDITEAVIAKAITDLARNREIREMFIENGSTIIDGLGAARVVEAMQAPLSLVLKDVTAADSRLLWEWANDPATRNASFSSAQIPLDVHDAWFDNKIKDPNCIHLIGVADNGHPIGQVRFDMKNASDAEIHISIASECRRSGYGRLLIDTAVSEVFNRSGISTIHAVIKPDNKSSITAFEKAYFIFKGKEKYKGQTANHYVKKRDVSDGPKMDGGI